MSFKKRLLSYITATGGETWLREVEWLESPFSQADSIVPYIDTGIFPSWDVPFEMSATITKTSANRILPLSNYANQLTFYIEVTATNRVRFGSQDSTASDPTFVSFDAYTSSSYTIPLNKPTRIWVKYTPRNDSAHTIDYEVGLDVLDGSGITTSTTGTCYRSGSPASNTRTLRMFYDYRNALSTFDGGFKLHQLEIKYGTTHKKFISCIDKYETNCMYEQVEGKLYYNEGTGYFNKGRQITEVEWINLTGSQRFNTGFLPNELSTTLKATFEITPNSLETFPFGVRKLQGYEESCAMYIGPVVSGSPNGYLRLDWPLRAGGSTARYNFTATTEKITLEATGNYSNVNGQVLTANTVVDFTHPKPFYIGNCYTESTNAFQSAFKGKFYVVNLLNTYNRNDYRYCVPAHDENNVGFFFDRANHFIMDNEGQNTQDMTWGDEIHPISYIYGGFPSYLKTTGITFGGHLWETDMKSFGDGWALFGAASGAANYWGVNGDGSAYSLHTSNTAFDIPISAKVKRTVGVDCNDFGTGSGRLTLTVEGQSMLRNSNAGAYNTSTAYRFFNALMVSTYPAHTYLYANRCYDRTTTKLLQNLIPIQTGNRVCTVFDTETHTMEDISTYNPSSNYEYLSAGDSLVGYNNGPELPCGFVELNYLESTGPQWVDTGIYMNSDYGVEIEARQTATTQSVGRYLFGDAPSQNTRYLIAVTPGNNTYRFGLENANKDTNISAYDGQWHTHKIENKTYYIDGVSQGALSVTDFTAGRTSRLFSVQTTGTLTDNYWQVRSCKQYDNNGRIIANLIPALRTYDNKPGMYDLINRRFLTNGGTGEFKYGIGNLYSSLTYLESTGTQYLRIVSGEVDDTFGIKLNASMVAESDNYLAGSTGTGGNRIFYFGARTGNYKAWCYGWATSSTGTTSPRYSFNDYPDGLDNFYVGRLNFLNDKKVAFENETPTTMTSSDGVFTNTNINFFRTYKEAGCTARIKWGQVSRGSDIIRNCVPVMRISDGEVGMFDTVDGVFYTNEGTGTFNYPVEPNRVLVSSSTGNVIASDTASSKIGYIASVTSNVEQTGNKTTTINNSSTDTQYPSAKAVYDLINN